MVFFMYNLIIYNSVTFAKRIKDYFRRDGDYLAVIQTPSMLSPGGCSYSVKVKTAKLREVLEASRDLGFKVKGVYLQDTDGKYTVVNEA